MSERILPSINLSLCTRCNLCVSQCPELALIMTNDGPIFVDLITCSYCGVCEELCPTGAIRAPSSVIWSVR